MAPRTIRKVLGESSLGRKLRLLFGLSLLVLITGSFLWYGHQTNKLVYDGNRRVGKAFVRTALNSIHYKWWSEHEDQQENRGMLAKLFDYLPNKDYDVYVIIPQDPLYNPDKKQPPQDELEWELYRKWLSAGADPESDDDDDESYQRIEENNNLYYRPVFAVGNSCVDCHSSIGNYRNENLQKGDLLGIVRVTIPNAEAADAQRENLAWLISIAIVTVFLAMVALYVIVKHVVVKPLTHLRNVSDEISRGKMQQRAEIQTGDEFEDLGKAFNRMMQYMVDAQGELQHVNDNLDQKVDQLAQANMRLYQMNRLKSDFLATVSHELRTPLNSIIGFSDVLSSINALNDKQQRYVTNIQQSGRMLLEMINDILDLAKIESGKMKIRLTEFGIGTVVAAQCDMARPLTERKNIDLECDIDAGLPPLYQDRSKIQQIVSNLLSNAIKFTPEGGRITVSACRDDRGGLELVVADTGVGIAEEDQAVVFEKFRQGTTVLPGGDAMTREYTGTGLGLSIVKELCRLLGGEVVLQSELGKGSTFTVRLPWRRAEQPTLGDELAGELDDLAEASTLEETRHTDGSLGRAPVEDADADLSDGVHDAPLSVDPRAEPPSPTSQSS